MKVFFRSLMVLSVGLTAASPLLWSGITNRGDDSVLLEIKKESGLSESPTLYPGQSIVMPDGAMQVRVMSRYSSMRGDENIMVEIVESGGGSVTLTSYNKVYVLGTSEDEKEETVDLKEGRLLNRGNTNVNIQVNRTLGPNVQRALYPDQPIPLPIDTTDITVLSDKKLRGDEIIHVSATMPDGETTEITTLGGKATLQKED